MDKLKALSIVYDLAAGNALDDISPLDEELKKEEKRQQQALSVVYDMIEELRKDQHPNLLDIGILLKHFPSLFGAQTDMGSLKELEKQAKDLDKYPVYGGHHHLPMKLKLVNDRGIVIGERTWHY